MNKAIAIVAGCVLAFGALSAQGQGRRTPAPVSLQAQMPGVVTIHVGTDSAGRVIVQSSDGSAFAADPATGETTATSPEPADNAKPIPGIGVVIKKNPGGSAEDRTIPTDPNCNAMLPTDLEDGSYDLIVRLPRSFKAGNTNAERVAHTIHVTFTKGMGMGTGMYQWIKASFDRPAAPDGTTPSTCDHAINTKGTGSVRMANPNGTSCDPNSKDALKTRTKSNQSNE